MDELCVACVPLAPAGMQCVSLSRDHASPPAPPSAHRDGVLRRVVAQIADSGFNLMQTGRLTLPQEPVLPEVCLSPDVLFRSGQTFCEIEMLIHMGLSAHAVVGDDNFSLPWAVNTWQLTPELFLKMTPPLSFEIIVEHAHKFKISEFEAAGFTAQFIMEDLHFTYMDVFREFLNKAKQSSERNALLSIGFEYHDGELVSYKNSNR